MKYQKIISLLDNALNKPSKVRMKNWVEINDGWRGAYSTNIQIKFKTSMLKSSLCDYNYAYILVKGNITSTRRGAKQAARQTDERDKGVIFENSEPFTDCISKINNTQIDNAKDLDVAMSMYKLIEYSHIYSKTSRSLWKYYREELNDTLTDSESYTSKIKITGIPYADGKTKNVEIAVPLKYLRTILENP